MIEIVLINFSISDSLWQSADQVQLKIAIDKTIKHRTSFDGIDLGHAIISSLRSQIGIVSQDVILITHRRDHALRVDVMYSNGQAA